MTLCSIRMIFIIIKLLSSIGKDNNEYPYIFFYTRISKIAYFKIITGEKLKRPSTKFEFKCRSVYTRN